MVIGCLSFLFFSSCPGVAFYTYEMMKFISLHQLTTFLAKPGSDGQLVLSVPGTLTCGAVSGLIAQIVSWVSTLFDSDGFALPLMGLLRFMSWFQKSMDIILVCHPALSRMTSWVEISCELRYICTSPMVPKQLQKCIFPAFICLPPPPPLSLSLSFFFFFHDQVV